MEFSVNTTALPGLVGLLNLCGDDLSSGVDYVAKNTVIDQWDEGFLNSLKGTHEAVVSAVEQFLRTAAEQRAAPYAGAVNRAARYYAGTDAEVAARFDASLATGRVQDGYPGLPHPLANNQLGPEIFDNPTAPPGYPTVHDYRFDYEVLKSPIELFSPTTYAREAVWKVTQVLAELGVLDRPVDVLQDYFDQFAGDWAAFRACADVWDAVATEVDYVADSVDLGSQRLILVWTGEAAGNCQSTLAAFGTDLNAAVPTLRDAAANYRAVAEEMKQLTEALIAVVTVLCDICVDLLVSAKFGPELLIFDGALDAARIVDRVMEARGILTAAARTIIGFVDNVGGERGFRVGLVGKVGPLALNSPVSPALPGVAMGSRTQLAS